MITANNFRIIRIHASAFTHASEELRPNFVLKYALASWPETYDGDPISLPVPDEMSEDFPSVVLSSQDGASRIEASRGRINILWLRRDDSENAQLAAIIETLERSLIELFEDQRTQIGRLAVVAIREARVVNPGRQLAEQYCRDRWLQGPLNRPDGFEIHAHKVFDLLDDLPVNSWIRIKAAPRGPEKDGTIRVEQDLNTLAQNRDTHSFSLDQVRGFFSRASEELDTIMSLYFPGDADKIGRS